MQLERLRALVKVAGSVAHDINNAITPLALETEILLADAASMDQLREYAQSVRHAIEAVAAAATRLQDMRRVQEQSRETEAAAAAPPPQCILLVDDDVAILDSMRAVLELDGHHVVVAVGGPGAIDAFKFANSGVAPIDLVITDLGMPNMDGRELARAIKTLRPSVQVILLTGSGRGPADRAMGGDIDCVLRKPPRMSDLHGAIALCAARMKSAAA